MFTSLKRGFLALACAHEVRISALYRRLPRAFFLVCLVTASFVPASGEAVELAGRVTSSLYGWEHSDNTYWRSYTGFTSATTLWGTNQSRSLGLHTSLRWTEDLATNGPGTPETYVYDLYLKLSGYPNGSTVYIGRQFAYNVLGSSLIDGLRAKWRIVKSVYLDMFGGTDVSHETPDRIRSISKFGLFGGRVEYSRSRSSKFSLNWLARTSHGSISQHRVGIDVWKEIRRTELYSRVSYDLLDLHMAGILARLTARPGKWYLSTEFHWRRPSIDGNTIFSLIDADAYKGIRAEITRTIWRDLRVLGQYHQELFDGDDARRLVLGLKTSSLMIAWHHRTGYGGESDAFQLRADMSISRELQFYGSAFVSRYLVQPETPQKIDAHSSSAGLQWRPGWALRVRVEGQYLRNAVDASDYRLFVRIAKSFRISTDKSESGK